MDLRTRWPSAPANRAHGCGNGASSSQPQWRRHQPQQQKPQRYPRERCVGSRQNAVTQPLRLVDADHP